MLKEFISTLRNFGGKKVTSKNAKSHQAEHTRTNEQMQGYE